MDKFFEAFGLILITLAVFIYGKLLEFFFGVGVTPHELMMQPMPLVFGLTILPLMGVVMGLLMFFVCAKEYR